MVGGGGVCSEGWTEAMAGLLCSKLGFSNGKNNYTIIIHMRCMFTACNFIVAVMTILNPQASSQLECTVSDNGNVSCTATSDCDMELGVICLEQDFVIRLVDQECTTNCETMSTSTEVSDNSKSQPTTENVSKGSSQNCAIASSATSEVEQPSSKMSGSCPIASLGGVIGLLVVALVGLAIVTCCVLWKHRSQKQQAE